MEKERVTVPDLTKSLKVGDTVYVASEYYSDGFKYEEATVVKVGKGGIRFHVKDTGKIWVSDKHGCVSSGEWGLYLTMIPNLKELEIFKEYDRIRRDTEEKVEYVRDYARHLKSDVLDRVYEIMKESLGK